MSGSLGSLSEGQSILIHLINFDEYLVIPQNDTGHPTYLCARGEDHRWEVVTVECTEALLFAIPDLGVCFEWISNKIKEPYKGT
jgi:alpha-tubulin suppressor-like RCC1 family protein